MAVGSNRRLKALPCEAETLIDTVLQRGRRVLLFGPPGIGKSTLARNLADGLLAAGRTCQCLSADPGSPAFGPPGTLSLGVRNGDSWDPVALEPLCTLDAGRFRLPLVGGVRRLVEQAFSEVLLLDAPGVVRGVAGRELLQGLVETAEVTLVLVLTAPDRAPPLAAELDALPVEQVLVHAAVEARRPGQRARARARTAQWDAYLEPAVEQTMDVAQFRIIGTPPPIDEPGPWTGRQVALLRDGKVAALGEVLGLSDGRLSLRAPGVVRGANTLLVRDAVRNINGLLESAAPFAAQPMIFLPPLQGMPASAEVGGPRPMGRIGGVDVVLVNGILGDPLLHVRLRHQARSLLFDLGDGGRLPARIAHQVSDVFITHAHMDHLAGFVWLLRSRIDKLPPCRLYGPPGLAEHVSGLVHGFLWDRVGARGPAFEIAELHGDTVRRYCLRAGLPGLVECGAGYAPDGVIHVEPGFRVRATTLDHNTPVLAYAFEPEHELNVRKDRLVASGLEPGPWLTDLKDHVRAGDLAAELSLPDGTIINVSELAAELLLTKPAKRLVYATDLADTADNRARLQVLARHAHTLFLEASFVEADIQHAIAGGHLTGRACGEIAEASGVSRLVPFHLSRRYADDPGELFEEIRAACDRVVLPGSRDLSPGAEDLGAIEKPVPDGLTL